MKTANVVCVIAGLFFSIVAVVTLIGLASYMEPASFITDALYRTVLFMVMGLFFITLPLWAGNIVLLTMSDRKKPAEKTMELYDAELATPSIFPLQPAKPIKFTPYADPVAGPIRPNEGY